MQLVQHLSTNAENEVLCCVILALTNCSSVLLTIKRECHYHMINNNCGCITVIISQFIFTAAT